MKIQLLRHATMLLQFGGQCFIVDPMLSPAGFTSVQEIEWKLAWQRGADHYEPRGYPGTTAG